MSQLGSGPEATKALIKLLAKLELIEEKHADAPFPQEGTGPIAYFASLGCYEEQDALDIIASKLKVPLYTISKSHYDMAFAILEDPQFSHFTLERWKSFRAMPLEFRGKDLVVALANPLDQDAVKALRLELLCDIKVVLAKEAEILDLLSHKHNANSVNIEELIDQATGSEIKASVEDLSRQESNVAEHDLNAPPVVRIVNQILSSAVQSMASDLHLNPEKDHLSVKVRVDGIMRPLLTIPNTIKLTVISRIKLLAGMDIAEKRKPQDGRLRIKYGVENKDLRLSTVPTIHGENIVIRILSSDLNRITYEALGLNPEVQNSLTRILTGSAKVLLVTGPTGSGKTSTLYASLLAQRDGTSNIITIEDPIEYRIPGINQIQVNTKLGVTFAEGLRSILRQDPDIIMVGEIRDYDTCAIAMQAAQTGHLVISTLHTNSAPAAIIRMRDLGLPSYVLSSALGGVLAQRLVRKLCPKCAKVASDLDLSKYSKLGLNPKALKVAVGCNECDESGYRGRAGIYSFLEINDVLRECIRDNAGEDEIERKAKAFGFKNLVEAAVKLINAGVTTLDEIERHLGVLDDQSLTSTNSAHSETPAASKSPLTTPLERPTTKLAAGPIQKRRILVVEDDENTRMVLKLLLQREMFEVDVACDGIEGLEKTYGNPPHLIICDYMMPQMNGLEMIQKLRKDQRIGMIPVLMLTAADSESNEVQVLDSGADDFVSKASDSKIMIARVHRLLDRAGV